MTISQINHGYRVNKIEPIYQAQKDPQRKKPYENPKYTPKKETSEEKRESPGRLIDIFA